MTKLKFDQLGLSKEVLKAIEDMGFEYPSAIQAETIPTILEGQDIVGQAPTGTGKTAAYAIPLVQGLDLESKDLQALILCPTRELVVQVAKEFEKLTKYIDGLNIVAIYGGQQIEKQLTALRKKAQIVIATPGRLMDHLRRASIDVTTVKMAVLDEADEMLDMGFRDDIDTILKDTPEDRQTILFSATMARDILMLTKKLQNNPKIIDVTDKKQTAPNIEQFYFEVAERNKTEVLARLLDLNNVKLGLVFCNTKSQVDSVVEFLKSCGYFADSLHGDMNQNQRDKVMNGFRRGRVEILVATDVAGRGIDVNNIEAVFNYDLPRDDEDYIHRIGRTARAGRSGAAYTFVSRKQVQSIKRIERANGSLITKKEIPTAMEIETAKLTGFSSQIINVVKEQDLKEYVAIINGMVSDGYSVVEIAAALFKLKLDGEKKKFDDGGDLFDIDTSSDFEKPRRRSRDRQRGGQRDRQSDGQRSGGRGREFSRGGRRDEKKENFINEPKRDFSKKESSKRKPFNKDMTAIKIEKENAIKAILGEFPSKDKFSKEKSFKDKSLRKLKGKAEGRSENRSERSSENKIEYKPMNKSAKRQSYKPREKSSAGASSRPFKDFRKSFKKGKERV